MNREDFVMTWERATKILSKRDISSEYIEFNTTRLQVELWDADLVKELFDDLCSGSPKEAEITAEAIKKSYWNRYRIKHGSVEDYEPKPCKQSLCNGRGMVKTTKFIRQYGYAVEYIWRCPCVLGVNVHVSVPVYTHELAKKMGHEYVREQDIQPYTYDVHQRVLRELAIMERDRQNASKIPVGMEFNDEINRLVKSKSMEVTA